MYVTISNRASRVVKVERSVTICQWIFDSCTFSPIVERLFNTRPRVSSCYQVLWFGLLSGCDSEQRWSNILCRDWVSTTGPMVPVDILHFSNFPEPGRYKYPLLLTNSNQIRAQTAEGNRLEQ